MEGKEGRVEMALGEGRGSIGKAKENLGSSRRLKDGRGTQGKGKEGIGEAGRRGRQCRRETGLGEVEGGLGVEVRCRVGKGRVALGWGSWWG